MMGVSTDRWAKAEGVTRSSHGRPFGDRPPVRGTGLAAASQLTRRLDAARTTSPTAVPSSHGRESPYGVKRPRNSRRGGRPDRGRPRVLRLVRRANQILDVGPFATSNTTGARGRDESTAPSARQSSSCLSLPRSTCNHLRRHPALLVLACEAL